MTKKTNQTTVVILGFVLFFSFLFSGVGTAGLPGLGFGFFFSPPFFFFLLVLKVHGGDLPPRCRWIQLNGTRRRGGAFKIKGEKMKATSGSHSPWARSPPPSPPNPPSAVSRGAVNV